MSSSLHPRPVLLLLMLTALFMGTGPSVWAQDAPASPNAKLDGWITNFGQPSYAVPDLYHSHMEQGNALMLKGDLEGAAGEYLECVRLIKPYLSASKQRGDYRDRQLMAAYTRPLAQILVSLGHALRKLGRLESAIELYTNAADTDPSFIPAHESLGTALTDLGLAHHARRLAGYRGIGDLPPDETELSLYRQAIVHLHTARQMEPESASVRLALSIALRLWGDLQRAVVQAREGLDRDPQNSELHYHLGLALVRQGTTATLTEAVDHFREAAKLASNEPPQYQAEIQNALGLSLAGLGQFDDAVQAYAKAVELDPNAGVYRNNLGTALRAAGKPLSEPIAAHAAATILEPADLQFLLNLATNQREAGDLRSAAMAYRKALRVNSRDAEIHHQLGLTLHRSSDPDRAIQGFRSLMDRPLDDDAMRAALAVIAVHFLRNQRLSMVDAMDPRSYEVVPRLRVDPNPWPALRREVGRFWSQLDLRPLWGEARIDLQDMMLDFRNSEATILRYGRRYEKALELRSAGARAYVPLALPEELVQTLAADNPLAANLEGLSPEVRRSTVAVAMALQQRDDLAEAIAELRWARQRNPRSAHIANNLGKALFDAGQVPQALAQYEAAVRLDRSIPEVHFNRGVALGHLKQMSQAVRSWKQALSMGMEDARLYSYIGLAHLQNTELDLAKSLFLKAIVADETFAPAHYYLGLTEALAQPASPITGAVLQSRRVKTPLGRRHYDVRAEFIKLSNLNAAIAELKRAEELDPERRQMYYYTGVELALQDPSLSQLQGMDVIHCVTRVRGLMPDWAVVTNNMAVLCALDGDLDKAQSLLRTAVRDEPMYAMAHWNLGRVLILNKQEAEGKQELWRAATLARQQRLPYYFDAEPPVVPQPARLPREAAEEYRLKSLLESFDIPVPVL